MRLFPRGSRTRLAAALAGCLVIATTAAIALDKVSQPHGARGAPANASPDMASSFLLPGFSQPGLKPGTEAPPLMLADFRTGKRVSLDAFRGDRPVVLAFSSVDSPVFSSQLETLRPLYDQFKGRVAFLFVEVPVPPQAGTEQESLAAPGSEDGSLAARRERLAAALAVEPLPFPCLVDEDGRVEAAYAAYPLRLVVVGTGGLILYNAGLGRHVYGPAITVSPTGDLVPFGLDSSSVPADSMACWDLKTIEEQLRTDLAQRRPH
jgi:hypothetical protein